MRADRFRLRAALGLAALALGVLAGRSVAAESSAPIELRPVALYGADVRSLVFDPAAPDRVLAGSSAGHVYRSDDGGASWANAGAEIPFPAWVVGTLRFDPDRPARLWAGLWGIWGGGLVAYSDDFAATWQLVPLGAFADDQVYALARVPGSDRLIAGTRDGVLISDDLGASWRASGRDVAGLVHVSSLYVDPDRTDRIVSGTWRRAFRSEDGGASWRGIFEGMALDSEVFSLHPVPGRPGELWASTCGWVYHAEAFGDRWSRRQQGLRENRTPSFSVISPERLLAGTIGGAHLSTDGGRTFRRTSRADLAVLAIAHHPARPERVLLGTEGSGIWLSNDGGESFVARPVGMRNVRVPALASSGDQVFAALAHAGPASGVFRSPDGGVSFEPAPAEVPTVLDLATVEGRLFAATERGLFERSGSAWRRVVEAGERRVEQLATAGQRLAARAAHALLEGVPGPERWHWSALPFSLSVAAPLARDIALVDEALWILSDDGLFRRQGGLHGGHEPVAASLPYRGGRLTGVGGELVYSGDGGIFRRDRSTGAWTPLVSGAGRALATGDARFALVALTDSGAALFDRELHRLGPIATPFPAAETLSALVVGNRLLLGTSGYGLWEGRLPE